MVDKMDKNAEIIAAVKELSLALDKYHGNSETARYVKETLGELQKSKAVDFIGSFTYFLPKAAMLRRSEGIKLNKTEDELWHKMASYKDIGYKLFPSFGM